MPMRSPRSSETASLAGKSTVSGLSSVTYSAGNKAVSRDFADKVLSLLIEDRRRLAEAGCLAVGVQVASSEARRAARSFLHRLQRKLEEEPSDLVASTLACGSRLLELGEFELATLFFGEAKERVAAVADEIDGIGWSVDAEFGEIECDVLRVRRLDPSTKYPRTAQRLLECARRIQGAMARLLREVPPEKHEALSWIFLNGSGLIHCVAEPLANYGDNLARHAAEFLFWCAAVLDCVVSLSTTKYLPLRSRFYALAARACDRAGKPSAVKAIIDAMRSSVASLRSAEEMQSPLPAPVQTKLENAELDCKLLEFRARVRAELVLATDLDAGCAVVFELVNDAFSSSGDDDDSAAKKIKARALFESLGEMRGLEAALLDDASEREQRVAGRGRARTRLGDGVCEIRRRSTRARTNRAS